MLWFVCCWCGCLFVVVVVVFVVVVVVVVVAFRLLSCWLVVVGVCLLRWWLSLLPLF